MTSTFAPDDPRAAAGLAGTWAYTYDDIGQLTAWSSPDRTEVEYVYDALGNRITETRNGAVTTYHTNALNQYTKIQDPAGVTLYTYDRDGNLVRTDGPGGVTTYAFDEENRLVGVDSPDGLMTYNDNALGQRYLVDRFGEKSLLVTDPTGFGNLVGEYDPVTGSLRASHDYGFGLVASYGSLGLASFFTFDAMGNTAELTGSIGSSFSQYVSDPFGDFQRFGLPDATRFLFGGELGVTSSLPLPWLQDMRARSYDVRLGRFTSADPIGLGGEDTNLYTFVSNQPTTYSDPSGLLRFLWYGNWGGAGTRKWRGAPILGRIVDRGR